MKLWEGRFSQDPAIDAWKLNSSISFDQRMASQDIQGSIAWANAISAAGVLTDAELTTIVSGLNDVSNEFDSGEFEIQFSDEDIHTAVERRLGEIIGPLAGKLHTGRSRNDQVATDFRLWLLDQIPLLKTKIAEVLNTLILRAEQDIDVIMPGYTHVQQAQPILISHWWLSHFWALERDYQRLLQLEIRVSVMPLGSGALAGTTFEIDRIALAKNLGFSAVSQNSLDAVSDRDFAAEFLFFASLFSVHLSKMAESIILFSSIEFGFIELSDAYSTGSSLMPQKKNPDVFELARGKSGTLIGSLAGFMTTLKGLPSAYDKDLQEDKIPVFNAFDTLITLLPVISGAINTLTVNKEVIEKSLSGNMMAVALADYLVKKGIPFREAHHYVGEAVKIAIEKNVNINQLSLKELQEVTSEFQADAMEVFDFKFIISQCNSIGGTAPSSVKSQIKFAKEKILTI
jgi:argininosuccinate lyase